MCRTYGSPNSLRIDFDRIKIRPYKMIRADGSFKKHLLNEHPKAKPEDHINLTEITKKSKAFWGYSEEQILAWDRHLIIREDYIKKNPVFNLIEENKIIGYYSYLKEENNQVKLDNLFLLPEYIGKGFGTLLMNDFLERMRNEKCQKITLDSEPNAEKFYEKLGFKKVGEFETSIKNRFMPIMEMDL